MSRKSRWIVALVLLVFVCSNALLRWMRPQPDNYATQREIESAISAKNFDLAGQLADRQLKTDPRNFIVLLQRGRICAAQEQWEQALSFFDRIPNDSASAADARLFEGLTYLEMHRAVRAEQAFLQVIDLAPEAIKSHQELAMLYASQFRVRAMRTHLNAILSARPWTLDEFSLHVTGGLTWGLPAQRTAQLASYIAADPGDIDSTVALVQFYIASDQTGEADKVLAGLGERFSNEPRVRALIAESAMKRNDLQGAREALDFDPSNTPAMLWSSRGQYAAIAGDKDTSVDCLSEATRLAPDDILVCYRMGQALKQASREEEAQSFLERAKLLDRLNHRCMRALGAESQENLDAVLFEIGDMLLELERWVEAGLAFERLLEREGTAVAARPKYALALDRFQKSRGISITPGESTSRVSYPSLGSTSQEVARTAQRGHVAIRFEDQHRAARVNFRYFTGETGLRYLMESMGGGVSVLDFDGDGWPDLFFPQGARLPVDPSDRSYVNGLFRNLMGSQFEDVADLAGVDQPGYGIGCAAGDYNNDGFSDLVVTRFGTNKLYCNNGDGTFADVTIAAGIVGTHLSSSVAFADFDRDGNLDLFVINYLDFLASQRVCRNEEDRPVTCHPRSIASTQDLLYENVGDGTFDDITEPAGIVAPEGKGLGIVVADFDGDDWPDAYIANDTTPNFMYRNRAEQFSDGPARARFEEIGVVSGSALCGDGQAKAGMGIACGDLDGNGYLDLYVTNYLREYNTLFLNHGRWSFSDDTQRAALVAPTLPVLGFGTQAIDADLNGTLDLFVANGHVEDVRERGDPWKMPPQLFYNLGAARFVDVSLDSGEYFGGKYLGRGVSRVDWDRDDRPDLVVVHQDRPAALLHNETETGNRIVLDLIGRRSNRDAINTRIVVRVDGHSAVSEICGGDGYLGTNERRQIIGIGDARAVGELEVRWPSGEVTRCANVPANCHVRIAEGREAQF